MGTKEFKGIPTSRQVTETLNGIKSATKSKEKAAIGKTANIEGLSAEEERLIEKHERIHGKRETTWIDSSSSEEEYILKLWVFDNIPANLRNNAEVRSLFKKVALGEEFQALWNYKISIPEGLNEKTLIGYSAQKIEELESLSEIELNSGGIASSGTILRGKESIEKVIEYLASINEYFSRDTHRSAVFFLSNNTFFYLMRKIVIEKLKEIIRILDHYKPISL